MAIILVSNLGARAGDITVFAAASMKAPLDQIAAEFENSTGHRVRLSLAGSSVLARQIEYGAPADVFISANPQWMAHIASRIDLDAGRVQTIATNNLVIATQGNTGLQDLHELQPNGKIAVPLINAVPLGIYARQSLENLGIFGRIAPFLLQTDNALSARKLLETGQVELAILYASDVAQSDDLKIVAHFPAPSHDPVLYQAAAITSGAAQGFVAFLQGEMAQGIFADLVYKAQ